jgi:hypothetical protein
LAAVGYLAFPIWALVFALQAGDPPQGLIALVQSIIGKTGSGCLLLSLLTSAYIVLHGNKSRDLFKVHLLFSLLFGAPMALEWFGLLNR